MRKNYEPLAKCPLGLYVKPSNKGFINPLLKSGFCFFGKSIQKHLDSVCVNDAINQQNVRAYFMPNH